MKNKYEIMTIVVTWTSFLVWEYYVQQWAMNQEELIIRVDLIILLPSLVLLTLWMYFKMKEKS